MRKLVIGAITAVCTLAVGAQQPAQCVNPDALNGLVFLGRADLKMTVSRALPLTLSGFRAPGGWSLIGTGVREAGITVAYKTSLSAGKAYAALLAAHGTEGWAIERTGTSAATFNVAGGPREGTVCRGGERRILAATEVAGVTYANISMYPQPRPRDCNALEQGLQAMSAAPRFQFPAGTSLGQGVVGGSGSDDMYTVSSRIISAEAMNRLGELLASQIESQGWRRDSDWSGSGSAGSTWRKGDEGKFTAGVLEIIRVSDGTYDVDFTMALPR